MTLREFELNDRNHFIAMEYYRWISNRTFLLLITQKELIGIKVNGMIGVQSGDPLINLAYFHLDPSDKEGLQNPYAYINPKYIEKIKDVNVYSDEFLKINRAHFIIRKSDLYEVTYDPRKKWGMGYYPHDGKIYLRTKDFRKREFIILGAQSGQFILENLTVSNF